MQMMKNENGVTIVSLVVTIIVTIIIAGISMTIGMDSINDTKDRKLQAELEIVGQAAITEYTKAVELGYIKEDGSIPANFIGTPTSHPASLPSKTWKLSSSEAVGYKSYFTLTPADLKNLEVLNSEHNYIINYYTGEVFNETKKTASSGADLYIIINNAIHSTKDSDTESFVE